MLYRTQLGKPDTKCILPSGDTYDTKILIGSNKHSQNNKLGTLSSQDDVHIASEFKPCPGMRTNLQIDWGNQSKAFKEFIDEKSSGIKKEPIKRAKSSPITFTKHSMSSSTSQRENGSL